MKTSATQRKQIATLVKAAKQSDGKVTWQQLFDAETAAMISADDAAAHVAATVYAELRVWSDKAKADYHHLNLDCDRVAPGAYLFDENVDAENVCGDGVTTELSVDYWPRMIGTAGPTVGDRAHEAGLDINALLGRCIY